MPPRMDRTTTFKMESRSEVMTYIGTLDVPRPSSRVEIVAAMRRIRYEFKAKAIKKKKVVLTVSVDGVKVTLRKNKKQKNAWNWDDSRLLVMHHPIYRIFYVSHDSQDLKIWSYIARDGPSNVFKCNVFKAYKKSQAMRIVRTIGQAFEVCHKLGSSTGPSSDHKDEASDRSSEDNERRVTKNKDAEVNEEKELNTKTQFEEAEKVSPPTDLALKQTILQTVGATTISSPLGSPMMLGEDEEERKSHLPLSTHHQMQLMRQQLEQQQHQTQVAIAQVHLLKDQLSAETAARIEAQSQAMRIVRTIGQAFEVCHKLGSSTGPSSDHKDEASDRSSEDNERRVTKNKDAEVNEEKELNTKTQFEEAEKVSPPTDLALKQTILQTVGATTISSPLGSPMMLGEDEEERKSHLPLSTHHQMQLMRQQLEQQQHQTQVAIAQVHLLKDQLSAETAARIEAQARAHQLLLHNKDLLDHMTQLVGKLQGLEMKVTGVTQPTGHLLPHSPPAQVPALPDPSTPRSAPVHLPQFQDGEDNSYLSTLRDNATYQNTKAASLDAESPDSGHKEMSSESLTFTAAQADTNGWSHNFNSVSPTKHAPRNPFESSFNPTSAAVPERKGDGRYGAGASSGDSSRLIHPLPFPESAANRRAHNLSSPAPRIEPPPRVHRASRSFDRSERGSWYGGGGGEGMGSGPLSSTSMTDSGTSSTTMTTDSDYYSSYANRGLPLAYQRQGQQQTNGGGGSHGLNALMRYSDSSARSSMYSEGNRDSTASLSAVRQKLDLKVNEVSHNSHGPSASSSHHSFRANPTAHDHHSANGRWKLRISYTSDENSDDNSDEMNVAPSSPSKGSNAQKIQLSALEEFDTIRS